MSTRPSTRRTRRLLGWEGERRVYAVQPCDLHPGQVEIHPDRIVLSPETWQVISDATDLRQALRRLASATPAERGTVKTFVGDAGRYGAERQAQVDRAAAKRPPGVLEAAEGRVGHLITQLTRASSPRQVPNFSQRVLDAQAELEALQSRMDVLAANVQLATAHLASLVSPKAS
jgi:hypothetical protein